MIRRSCLMMAAVTLIVSCTRHVRTERLMTWSEETQWRGMALPGSEKIIVLRYIDDPGQGLIEDWNSALRDRLARLGNPARVTFDCWRKLDGGFGFSIAAIGGEPYFAGASGGPSRAGAFSEGTSRPNPLEAAIPRWD